VVTCSEKRFGGVARGRCRVVLCELDAKCEDRETRPFASGFLEGIEARRSELLTAALTILRWGRQNSNSLIRGRPLGSFEPWCEWVRDPPLTLGYADPVERIEQLKAHDPRRQNIAEFFHVWDQYHGQTPIRAALLDEEVERIINPQRLPRQFVNARLQQLAGTRAAGFVLTRQEPVGKWGAATYSLTPTTADIGDGKKHRGIGTIGQVRTKKPTLCPLCPTKLVKLTLALSGVTNRRPRCPLCPIEEPEQPADEVGAARSDHSALDCQTSRGEPRLGSLRPFVYQRRSPEYVLNRIRRYEQEHPRPFRRFQATRKQILPGLTRKATDRRSNRKWQGE
jgi:hypothetical protein